MEFFVCKLFPNKVDYNAWNVLHVEHDVFFVGGF